MSETTRYKRLEALVHVQDHVLEMMLQRVPFSTILDTLTQWAEEQSQDGLLASILLLDQDGRHLYHGAAPSLPKAYNQALDGIELGPRIASYEAAAFTKNVVLVEDVANNQYWKDFCDLALSYGLFACWSTPLLAKNGDVLGLLILYYRQPRQPSVDDLQIIQLITRMVVTVVEHKRIEEERNVFLAREQQVFEQSRAERQQLYNLLMDAPAIIVVLRGPEHVCELINPACMRTIGQGREVLGKSAHEALPELQGQGIYELLDEVYATGKPFIGHEILIKLDRSGNGILEDVYYNVVYQPLRDLRGEIDGILVHGVDVTELVQARKKVEESEEHFRTLADNMSQFAWMADQQGWTFWYNQRWYDYTGTTLEEMKGWGWQKVHHPEHIKRVMEKVKRCFQSGEVWEDTFPLRGKDGNYRWFLSRAIPIKDENGHVTRWFGTNTDITEQRQLEQQKDDFIGIASHELKTPVTSLKAYAQVLHLRFRKAGDARSAELLEKMNGQLNRLTSLISDLLDVTKIQSGKLLFHKNFFDYNQLIKEVIEEVQRTTTKHTIIQELASTSMLHGDRDRIGQVLINLITNAIKYSPQADTIIVRTTNTEQAVITSVQDFGVGIPKEQQEKVFDRFFRVGGEKQETYPGLGLGLYISAEIVERHHGSFWVESEEGKGTTFSFSLPLKEEYNRSNHTLVMEGGIEDGQPQEKDSGSRR